MNPFDLALTVMTYWVKAFVRVDSNGDQLLFFIKRLFFHRDSTKIKEWIKLYLGHRFASSGQFLLIQILYPEKQAVSIFISLFYQLFGRRTKNLGPIKPGGDLPRIKFDLADDEIFNLIQKINKSIIFIYLLLITPITTLSPTCFSRFFIVGNH